MSVKWFCTTSVCLIQIYIQIHITLFILCIWQKCIDILKLLFCCHIHSLSKTLTIYKWIFLDWQSWLTMLSFYLSGVVPEQACPLETSSGCSSQQVWVFCDGDARPTSTSHDSSPPPPDGSTHQPAAARVAPWCRHALPGLLPSGVPIPRIPHAGVSRHALPKLGALLHAHCQTNGPYVESQLHV